MDDVCARLARQLSQASAQGEIEIPGEPPLGDMARYLASERMAFSADEQVLDPPPGKTVDEICDLPSAAVEVPSSFEVEDLHNGIIVDGATARLAISCQSANGLPRGSYVSSKRSGVPLSELI